MSARDGAVIGEMDAGKADACAGGVIHRPGDRHGALRSWVVSPQGACGTCCEASW